MHFSAINLNSISSLIRIYIEMQSEYKLNYITLQYDY
jgi:hypothetical protein